MGSFLKSKNSNLRKKSQKNGKCALRQSLILWMLISHAAEEHVFTKHKALPVPDAARLFQMKS